MNNEDLSNEESNEEPNDLPDEEEDHFLPPYRKYVDEYDENLTSELVATLNRFADQYVPSEDMEKGCVKRFWQYVKERWEYEIEYYEIPPEEEEEEY